MNNWYASQPIGQQMGNSVLTPVSSRLFHVQLYIIKIKYGFYLYIMFFFRTLTVKKIKFEKAIVFLIRFSNYL